LLDKCNRHQSVVLVDTLFAVRSYIDQLTVFGDQKEIDTTALE